LNKTGPCGKPAEAHTLTEEQLKKMGLERVGPRGRPEQAVLGDLLLHSGAAFEGVNAVGSAKGRYVCTWHLAGSLSGLAAHPPLGAKVDIPRHDSMMPIYEYTP
jgi:hypothetical protein